MFASSARKPVARILEDAGPDLRRFRKLWPAAWTSMSATCIGKQFRLSLKSEVYVCLDCSASIDLSVGFLLITGFL